MKNRFYELLKNDFLILDGAMGTMIQQSGADLGDIHGISGITHGPLIQSIHRLYVEAGAQIIYANSFGANRYKLEASGYSPQQVIMADVTNAKRAVEGTDALVALDLGPIGRLIEPGGDMTFEEAYSMFQEMVVAGKEAGADLVVMETLSDLYEAKAAILAVKENSDFPIICTMTFEANMRTFTGLGIPAMALTLEGLGVDALGINCSLGPKEMAPIVEELSRWTNLPLVVKPNAGMPDPETEEYLVGAQEFCDYMEQLIPFGVKIVGGCCGTRPEYIQALKARFAKRKFVHLDKTIPSAVTTGINVLVIDQPRVIGERINPTGKKAFKEALASKNMDYIIGQAFAQKDQGADILDVNVGLPEIDEPQMMAGVVKALQRVIDLPLQIDSADPLALEAGLRVYNGKPIVNSVNGEAKSLEKILPLVKKYGASVVGLTLDEKGIPQTAQERFDIAARILEKGLQAGIKKQDIYIDCLTLTASAEQERAMDVIHSLRRVKEELHLKTVLGVSNISFGLPNRQLINHNFLALALGAGLDLPIMNPGDDSMMDAIRAYKLLANIDRDAREYIKTYQDFDGQEELHKGQRPEGILEGSEKENPVNKKSSSKAKPSSSPEKMTLIEAIEKGWKEEGMSITRDMIATREPMEIVREFLIPALDRVGQDFERGDIFLPQLLLSAGVAQGAFDVIKKHMADQNTHRESRGKILLATVKGDIHDIGKNIVKVLLENYDYEVVDLGKDVSQEAIVEKVIEEDIKLVGLSALMTTTLKSMDSTIGLLKRERPDCAIMVGGAVLTEAYAKKIGADYYGSDAKKAVDIANHHFSVV